MAERVSRFVQRAGAFGLLIAVCGCVSGRQGPFATQRIQDPAQLSPYARSLTDPDTTTGSYGVRRPIGGNRLAPAEQSGPLTTIMPRSPNIAGESSSAPVEGDSLQGPALGELSAPPPSDSRQSPADEQAPADEQDDSSIFRGEPLMLAVDSPENATVGGEVAFEVTVRNSHREAVDGVTILCSLPEGLAFPGASQRAFRQRVGLLKAGQKRLLELSLLCEHAGLHCVEFQVIADGFDAVSESACVACRDEHVLLDVTGPSERTVGSRAEFVVAMTNSTGREQPNVHIILRHEGGLEPREASSGVLQQPGRLEWDLGLVRVDERVQIQVDFACSSVTGQTCVTALVTGRDLPAQEVKSYLQIASQREMEIDVIDEQDTVIVGEMVVYRVRVTNHGLEPALDVAVKFVTDGLQPVGVTADGIDLLSSADFDPSTGILRVPLTKSLPVNATRVLLLQTIATHSGQGRLKATVTQRNRRFGVTTVEPTVVNAIPGSIAWGTP